MAERGAPPMDTSMAKALIKIIMGNVTPSPASAYVPMPSMCPTYILSTMLYSKLTSCASTHGTASDIMSLYKGACSNFSSISDFLCIFLLLLSKANEGYYTFFCYKNQTFLCLCFIFATLLLFTLHLIKKSV